MMEFLYFPENKWEYLPAAISFVLFFIGAIVTFYLFQKSSQKQLERKEQPYEEKKQETDTNLEHSPSK